MEVNFVTQEEFHKVAEVLHAILRRLEDFDHDQKSSLLYTNDQLAIKLGISKKTLQNWRDQGKIAFTQVGRKIFYTQDAVRGFLNKSSLKTFNK